VTLPVNYLSHRLSPLQKYHPTKTFFSPSPAGLSNPHGSRSRSASVFPQTFLPPIKESQPTPAHHKWASSRPTLTLDRPPTQIPPIQHTQIPLKLPLSIVTITRFLFSVGWKPSRFDPSPPQVPVSEPGHRRHHPRLRAYCFTCAPLLCAAGFFFSPPPHPLRKGAIADKARIVLFPINFFLPRRTPPPRSNTKPSHISSTSQAFRDSIPPLPQNTPSPQPPP